MLSIGQLASDVLALMDHLELGEAVFAGCSIGGLRDAGSLAKCADADAGAGVCLLEAAARC